MGALSFFEASCVLQAAGLPSGTSEGSTSSAGVSSAASASSGSGGGSGSGSGSGGGSGSGSAGTGAGGSGGGTTGAGGGGGTPPIAVAGELLVNLEATDTSAGTDAWDNKGTLGGGFAVQGTPKLVTDGSVKAVQFDGYPDAYVGPNSVPGIEDNSDRSIEVWVNNPSISSEESMVSWSDRDGPDGTMMSFNYGTSSYFGAVTHGGDPDLPWSSSSYGVPEQGKWHHLAYTFDGTTARVYADGVEKRSKDVKLATKHDFSINIAAERNQSDLTIHGSLLIAVVRIHDGALTAEQVKANFTAEQPHFQ